MRTHVEQVKKEMSSKISGTGLLSIRAKNGTEETKTESFPWPFFRKKTVVLTFHASKNGAFSCWGDDFQKLFAFIR